MESLAPAEKKDECDGGGCADSQRETCKVFVRSLTMSSSNVEGVHISLGKRPTIALN
jgi:hypothetical protein